MPWALAWMAAYSRNSALRPSTKVLGGWPSSCEMVALSSSSALWVMALMTEVSMTVCFTPRSSAIQRALSSSMAWRWPYWKVMASTLPGPNSCSARKRQVVESCPPEKITAAFWGDDMEGSSGRSRTDPACDPGANAARRGECVQVFPSFFNVGVFRTTGAECPGSHVMDTRCHAGWRTRACALHASGLAGGIVSYGGIPRCVKRSRRQVVRLSPIMTWILGSPRWLHAGRHQWQRGWRQGWPDAVGRWRPCRPRLQRKAPVQYDG